jgi:hypothetical protein
MRESLVNRKTPIGKEWRAAAFAAEGARLPFTRESLVKRMIPRNLRRSNR